MAAREKKNKEINENISTTFFDDLKEKGIDENELKEIFGNKIDEDNFEGDDIEVL